MMAARVSPPRPMPGGVPKRRILIRAVLGVFLMAAPASWSTAAQCILNNSGGGRTNIYRPADVDVPAAAFSPLGYVNKELPGWLCLTGGYRARYEGYTAYNFQ